MAVLTHTLTHAADQVVRLQEQHKTTTWFLAYLNQVAKEIQLLEDSAWNLYTQRALSVATGDQLDKIGLLLLEPRQGLGDADYVTRLTAKIRVLKSDGTAPDIVTIYKLLLPNNTIKFYNIGRAGFHLDIGTAPAAFVSIYRRFLHEAKSAGINAQLGYNLDFGPGTFQIAKGSVLTSGASAGATALVVASTADFTVGDLLSLSYGTTLGELRVCSAIPLTVPALTNTHPVGAAVKSLASAGGFYALTGSTIIGATVFTIGAHTLQIGDLVQFEPGITAKDETLTISAIGATTITTGAAGKAHASGTYLMKQPTDGWSDTAHTSYGGSLAGVIV